MSTVVRSLKGTLVGGLSFLVHAVQTVLLVPVMLNGWGASQYSMWLTCQAGMSMLTTLESGHLQYVGNELAKSLPVDRQATRTIFGSAIRFAVAIALTQVLLVAIIALSGSTHLVLGVSEEDSRGASLGAALFVLVLSFLPFGAIGGIFARLSPPAGKFVRATVWAVVYRIVVSIAAAVPAVLHLSLLKTAACVAFFTTVFTGICLADCIRIFPEFRPFLQMGSFRNGWRQFRRSWTITASIVMTQLQTSGMTLLVSSLFGSGATASFATIRTLSSTVVQAGALVFQPAVPEFVRLHVREELEKLRLGLFGLGVVTSSAATVGALLLAAVAEPLYLLWTRNKIPFDSGLFHLVVAGVLWRIAGFPLMNHLLAMNDGKWISIWSVSQTGLLFALASVGSTVVGILSVGAAILLSEIVGSYVIPALWMHQTLPNKDRRDFAVDHGLAALVPLTGTVCLWCASGLAGPWRVATLAFGSVSCIGLMAGLFLRVPVSTRRSVLRAAVKVFTFNRAAA